MNLVNKFLLVWDECFWDDVTYIFYTPEVIDKYNFFLSLKKPNPSTNALMTFAYADEALKTETMEDKDLIAEIMVHLRDMYGQNIPEPKHFARTKWYSNPHARGSYSFP